jgi:uncharacterized protein (DUF302 family)
MSNLLLGLILLSFVVTGWAAEPSAKGLQTVRSAHGVAETTDRLVAALEAKGMTIFARIDHTAGAEKVGLSLRPTQVVVFGNPKVGTLLMQCAQTIGIDLPLKALVWEDAQGQTWLGYNTPDYLSRRHQIAGCQAPLAKIGKAQAAFAAAATKP